MNKVKISTPNNIMNEQTYILDYFCDGFSEIKNNEVKSSYDHYFSSKNLTYEFKKGKFHFRNIVAVCPHCNGKLNNNDGNKSRELVILHHGEQECAIQRYICKSCGSVFYTDMSSLVFDNWNVTIPVIETIERLYRNYGAGVHKIRQDLKENYNVEISHQTIENILMLIEMDNEYDNWSLSGHYLFDGL